MEFALVMLVACGLDLLLGWPDWLFARIGHPVTWAGRCISALERAWNAGTRQNRLVFGATTALLLVGGSLVAGVGLHILLPKGWPGVVLGGVLAWPLVALRSMHSHVQAVEVPLARGDLPAARHAVSMIVGRDVSQADDAAISRAALESLAENSADGIVAPVFWGVVAGLPGIMAYKAINTLDSMIGHRNERYEAFGKVAARLDDLANLVPARLTGVFFALVGGRPMRALRIMWRDAPAHRSPNAGWPEAAMAASLGVRLSGPRQYGDTFTPEPWLNADGAEATPASLTRGLAIYGRMLGGLLVALAAIGGLAHA
ncbi:MAG: cobalamin biosynthesis protein CobD [Alphaproteobacteria bacterium]|jgi:adenosylcobinamide-phosphate synthase|nr:cobalamin biosynthesis protein CobD [Alphaproteobacteria bacterium]